MPQNRLAAYRSYSDAGEWAELLDVLCASLVKRKIPITHAERDALAELLAMFDIPKEGYAYISEPDKTLAALTVTD